MTVRGADDAEHVGYDATVVLLRLYESSGTITKVALVVYEPGAPATRHLYVKYVNSCWKWTVDPPTRWTLDTGIVQEPAVVFDFRSEEELTAFGLLVAEGLDLEEALERRRYSMLGEVISAMGRDELSEPPIYVGPPSYIPIRAVEDELSEHHGLSSSGISAHELAIMVAFVWALIRYILYITCGK
ncbi:hypothetical protein C8Q76DRAFT_799193 [Earliella scabrosa]|nr:hypothetical protein C8Q76DRAFT_799193 [Earliella scabrosa]